VTGTIKVETRPVGVAITPNGRTVYVANAGSGSVSAIAVASGTVAGTIKVGLSPYSDAVSPQAPVIASAALSRRSVRAGKRDKLFYTLWQPGSVTIKIKNRRGRVVKVLSEPNQAWGKHTVAFKAAGRKKLKPGRYRALVSATDAAGTSAPSVIAFRVTR